MSPWNEAGKAPRPTQLTMVEPDSRDAFLAHELDEMETRIHTRITMLEDKLSEGFKDLHADLKDREDRVSKRFTSLTTILITLLVSIATGAVGALINAQAG